MRRLAFQILTLVTLVLLSSLAPLPAQGQGLEINLEAEYSFGNRLVFRGEIPDEMPVLTAIIFFQAEAELHTRSLEARISDFGIITGEYDLAQQPVRAFSQIEYWLEAILADGQNYTSAKQSFFYSDNRYTWQEREAGVFRVHWYSGDALFAQSILDVAQEGLRNSEELLQVKLMDGVDIYAYTSAQEMRAALQTRGQNWVGAHTDPDLAVMVLSLPAGPEQRLEMERQIPHELTHILLYQQLGDGYDNLPVWVNEGLASVAELYPNPDYLILLGKARQNDAFLPIESLCQGFPRDASGAYLAYAEATSFTRYLYQTFGNSSLAQLISNYADGMDCQRGVQVTFGESIVQLDRRWRREAFGENSLLSALDKFLPWLLLMAAVLFIPMLLVFSKGLSHARK